MVLFHVTLKKEIKQMLYIKFKKYVRRVCIHKNNTINSQYDWLDWRNRIFGDQMKVITHKFWGLQSRNGKGMKGRIVSGATTIIRNGIIINPITAPPVFASAYWRNNGWISRKVWLQNMRIAFSFNRLHQKKFKSNTKKLTSSIAKWFKFQSYINSIKPLLQTFKATSQIYRMSTLSLKAQTRSNDYVSIRHQYPR